MGRFRFSLAALFGLIAFAAVGCTALVNASHWWACVLFTAAFAASLVAALIAMARSGLSRRTATGFAVCGFAYLLAMFSPALGQNIAAPRMLTREALLALHPVVERPAKQPQPTASHRFETEVAGNYSVRLADVRFLPPTTPTWTHFQQVGHSLFALVFAFLGAILSRWLYQRREAKT